jgi:hypothetical protein
MPGLNVTGTVWDQITGFEFTNNVWVDRNGTGTAVDVASGIADADIGTAFDSFSNNAFYTDQAAPFDGRDLPTWLTATGVTNTGNTVAARSGAAAAEGWTAPTRTLRTYCEDVLGLDGHVEHGDARVFRPRRGQPHRRLGRAPHGPSGGELHPGGLRPAGSPDAWH